MTAASIGVGPMPDHLVHWPTTTPRGWLVWAHGGPWQSESAARWAEATQAIAELSGWAVVSVDYRLAPAHPYPAAVCDLLAALARVTAQDTGLPVVVGGDSAGGTIAALAALAYRRAGDPAAAQLLVYPPLDPCCTRPSYLAAGSTPTRSMLRAAWQSWLSGCDEQQRSQASILDRTDLAGLAPGAVVVGDHDPVRDDAGAYARQLRGAGVSTRLDVLPGVGHGALVTVTHLVLPAIVQALAALTAPDPDQRGRTLS